MSKLLAGRAVVVVGAAGGIGKAVAAAVAAEGADLLVADRRVPEVNEIAEACRATASLAEAASVDVCEVGSVDAMKELALKRLGRVDALVNCVGVLTEAALEDLTVAAFDEMIAVTLRGTFLLCRAFAPHMKKRGSGRIINFASQLGINGGVRLAHYSAAKAGVIGFTKSIARELAPYGVLVNAIAPGPIVTPMTASITPDWVERKRAELPLGRFGFPEEVAPTVVLLASDPGGNLYVGQTLGPNSGDVMQ
ncbi:MAG: SDR family NAD(P)-dependent oxidoreductase [Acidimicrobiales bacterium]